jgi:hypothetical protein
MADSVCAAVGIAVQLERRTLERLESCRERPVRTFVRRQLDDALEPELSLDLLDRLPRLIRDEPGERRAEKALVDAPEGPGHEVVKLGS